MIVGANSVVILSIRCARMRRSFGLRMEDRGRNVWEGTWAFKMKEGTAEREAYGTQIQGNFVMGDGFKGCPYCEQPAVFLCECNKLACYDGHSNQVTCPTCNESVELGGAVTSLNAGSDA